VLANCHPIEEVFDGSSLFVRSFKRHATQRATQPASRGSIVVLDLSGTDMVPKKGSVCAVLHLVMFAERTSPSQT